jgi:hypothetical protein
MPGLRDIAAKLRRTVTIAGEAISVRGLTANEMAELLGEHPELGKLMSIGIAGVDADAMQAQLPDWIAKTIAIGTSANGKPPEPSEIDEARALPGAAALDLVAAIAELSLPRAVVRPFVALIADGEAEPFADTGRAPGTR